MATAGLSEELKCSVCLNRFINPLTLRCGHSFCRGCIGQALDTQEGSGGYSCPECREEFQERPALQRNIRLHNIVKNLPSAQPDHSYAGIPCTHCVDSPVAAVKSCLLCEVSLCEKHLRVHKKSPEHVLTDPTTDPETRKFSIYKIPEYSCSGNSSCLCFFCVTGDQEKELLYKVFVAKKEKLNQVLLRLFAEREDLDKQMQNQKTNAERKAARVTERFAILFKNFRKQVDNLEKRVMAEVSHQAEQILVSDLMKSLKLKEELSRKIRHIEELCGLTDPLTALWEPCVGGLIDAEEKEERQGKSDLDRTDKSDLDLTDKGDLDRTDKSDLDQTDKGDLTVKRDLDWIVKGDLNRSVKGDWTVRGYLDLTVKGDLGLTDKTDLDPTDKGNLDLTDKGGLDRTDKGDLTVKCDLDWIVKGDLNRNVKGDLTVRGDLDRTVKGDLGLTDKADLDLTDKGDLDLIVKGDLTDKGDMDRTDKGNLDGSDKGDLDWTVKDDLNRTVKGDLDLTVNGELDRTDKGDLNRTFKGDLDRTNKGDLAWTVKGDLDLTVKGDLDQTNKGDLARTVKGELVRTVKGDLDRTNKGDLAWTVKGDLDRTVKGNLDRTGKGDLDWTGKGDLDWTGKGDLDRTVKGDLDWTGKGDMDLTVISHTLYTGLSDVLSSVVGWVHLPEPAELSLDVDTAHANLHISNDIKTASWGPFQSVPDTLKRFQCCQVLSSQSFSSGRHFWEMEVGGSEEWNVGMCYPSMDRRGDQSLLGDNTKSWSLERWKEHFSVIHDSKEIPVPPCSSSQRIRIFLDYEAGQISFYELCHPIRHLHTFTTTFTEPLHAVVGVWESGYVKVFGRNYDKNTQKPVTSHKIHWVMESMRRSHLKK